MVESWPLQWGKRTYLMGALNVTPDSFSGDGLLGDSAGLLTRAGAMVRAGADVLDVGGESTRPGFRDVPAEVELKRVISAIQAVSRVVDVPLSIDTRKAVVAREALQAGALIVNDVSGLADSEMAQVVAEAGARLAIVHGSRIDDREDLIHALISDLSDLVERALRAGVSQRNIILDPGLGFGKGWLENFEILRRLSELRRLGLPLLVGPSRKGMIGKVLGVDVHDRLEGTIALVTIAIAHGVDMVRVHDVRENVQAARMADVLARNPARRNSMDTDRG